ncbi:MAG: superoxide dismutase [Candidatus Yonathbacteria bacterium]|nr:superoxide dismutase [Candidatus Yonathbacteria bacterium]NTW48031.1 superoxide dismutase [Candidatus Yonathbacteria bacterium]
MTYIPQNFEQCIGIPGLSENMLRNHFALYEGYVKNTNTIAELAKTIEPGTPQSAELRRRFGWEWDGMRLHELYFGNLTKEDVEPSSAPELMKAIEQAYGSFDAWKMDIEKAMMMRGIGWVVFAKDRETGGLFTLWINEHDGGHLVGTEPLLVLDVFEHAYMTDYGIKRADYVDVVMHAIDWRVVEERFVKSS